MIRAMAGMFLGEDGNRRDPLANPLYADRAGLPPMYIQTGADETLLDDSRALPELARKSGVDVTSEVRLSGLAGGVVVQPRRRNGAWDCIPCYHLILLVGSIIPFLLTIDTQQRGGVLP